MPGRTLTKSIVLAHIYQPLLGQVPLVTLKQVLRNLFTVRIAGALTPP